MFRWDNTANVKELARKPLPAIPRGDESFAFSIGQEVQHSGLGTYKRGVRCTIVDRWEQHGYCYYEDENGQRHRQKDLMAC